MLRLSAGLIARLRAEAQRCYPDEACGFLLGVRERVAAEVRRVVEARNRAERSDRFLIDARDVFAAMQAARAAGEELIGVYHSHPDAAAEPSVVDRDDAWGDWLHLIVSCRGGTAAEMNCWRLDHDTPVPVELHADPQ